MSLINMTHCKANLGRYDTNTCDYDVLYMHLSYGFASESVIKPCIKNLYFSKPCMPYTLENTNLEVCCYSTV